VAPTRGDLVALRTVAAADIHVVSLLPDLTQIMQAVDVCWAQARKTGRSLRTCWVPVALDRVCLRLPPAASMRRRTAARDSRVCIDFASVDAARGAASMFTASHGLSAVG
jgi:hypothetical protein